MGDVIVWKPAGDVLAFDEEAASCRQTIFDKLIETFRNFGNPLCDTVELNEEVVRLQRAYSDAREDAEIVLAVCDAANDQRVMLWRDMPEGQPCLLLAYSPGAFQVLILAKRNRAIVRCTRFSILKRRLAA